MWEGGENGTNMVQLRWGTELSWHMTHPTNCPKTRANWSYPERERALNMTCFAYSRNWDNFAKDGTLWYYSAKDTDVMADSLNLDKTAPFGAV